MRNTLITICTAVIVTTLGVLGFVLGDLHLSQNQWDTLLILGIICASSAFYCFVVGEMANNNSQMDKLWSILPIVYTWVVAARSGWDPRLIVYAAIATIWGVRLTINFARKGAYSIKFWTGEEDYRWAILRKKSPLNKRPVWALFDLFFICIYQNFIVLAMTIPTVAIMDSHAAFNGFDYLAITLALLFLLIEIVADEQQWKFQETKKKLLKEGKKLEELPAPYNLGFNTVGLWSMFRHPNYLGEQGIWISLYVFTVAAGVTTYGVFNWSLFGPLLLILLFMGSSMFGENISSSKYPHYKDYIKQVMKYLPLKTFDPNKLEK